MCIIENFKGGEVAERSNAAVLKTVASQGAVSSNLTLSAIDLLITLEEEHFYMIIIKW